MNRIVIAAAAPVALLLSVPAIAADPACATFDAYQHNQMLPAVSVVGDLTVSSFPANPIRIYDPANDSVKGSKGAVMADTLMFEVSGKYRRVEINWMSFNPGPTQVTITDRNGVILLRRTLSGTVQLKPLSVSYNVGRATRVMLMNGSKESLVSKVCFRTQTHGR